MKHFSPHDMRERHSAQHSDTPIFGYPTPAQADHGLANECALIGDCYIARGYAVTTEVLHHQGRDSVVLVRCDRPDRPIELLALRRGQFVEVPATVVLAAVNSVLDGRPVITPRAFYPVSGDAPGMLAVEG